MISPFLKAFLLSSFLFIVGVVIGILVSNSKIIHLNDLMAQVKTDIDNTELQFLILDSMHSNKTCMYLMNSASKVGLETYEMGKQVEGYEKSKSISLSDFNQLKMKYTSLLIRTWLYIEKIRTTCEGNYSTVLYFFGSKTCPNCGNQGMVLTFLKEKLNENLLVYAIDGDLDLAPVEVLKDTFTVNKYPTLIINGEKYEGFFDSKELTEILCSDNKNLSICNVS